MERKNVKLSIDSEIDLLTGIAEEITRDVFSSGLFDESRYYGLNLALFECLANALEHGNLEVTYDEKTADIQLGVYLENLRRKAKQMPYRARKIHIEYVVDDEGAIIDIQDEGSGFDSASLLEKIKHKEKEDYHGRGILLALNMVDSVQYSEKGSRVRIRLFPETQ